MAALLGAMLLVGWLEHSEVAGAASLAGMGFVMLTAYAVAEIGAALSLPQVTGFILAGVALGPSVGGVISGELVGDMRMFNTLALGLIATSAGLELDVRQMTRLMKTLLYTTLIKVVVGVALVALALFAVESWLGLLRLGSRAELATLALILGVLSIGTSPSIALAVLTETRAKGRLADLVLGAAVFKDLVVVVALAIAIAVGRVWLAPSAVLDSAVLGDVAIELGGSMLAGALVGGIFIGYVRFIRAEMLLFVAAMVLVVAELCRAFHLELLLVFITSGFVVRNFSRFEHDLMRPLRLVALPVFVLFFANAGASVDLATTYQILPIALAVCAARAAAFALASRVGGAWAGEPRGIRRQAWLAYLPQAGVTLGLVGLAGLQLPELAGPITNTGMAVVALNLLVGPITLRRALGVLGEIPPAEGEPAGAAISDDGVGRVTPVGVADASSNPPAALQEPLQRIHEELAQSLEGILERFEHGVRPVLPPWPVLADTVPELEVFQRVVVAQREQYRALYAALLAPLIALPALVQLERMRLPARGLVARRRLWRVRKVPLRRIARIALGPPLARLVARRFEDGLRGVGQAPVLPAALAGAALSTELHLGLGRLAELLHDASIRGRSARSLRYSQVEPEVRAALGSLNGLSDAELARLARAAWGSARLESARVAVISVLSDAVQHSLIAPGLATASKLLEAVAGFAAGLPPPRGLDEGTGREATPAQEHEDLVRLVRVTFTELAREFRFAAVVRSTLAELVASVADIPASMECLAPDDGTPLSQSRVQTVPFRAHVEALIRHLMPPVELAARSVATSLNQLPRQIEDALPHVGEGSWSPAEPSAPGQAPHALAWPRVAVQDAASATLRAVDATLAELVQSFDAAFASFSDEIRPGPTRDAARQARLQRWLAHIRRAWAGGAALPRLALGGPAPLPSAQAIHGWLRTSPRKELPEGVERWFDPSPASDDRLFAAQRRLLNYVLDADSSRVELGRSSLLIIGARGAGKSTLLNLCELELPYALHVRLHASEFDADVTLFDAMGTLLDCSPTETELIQQLEERAPAVFVDDLASWLLARSDRQAELGRILQLIARTSRRAFWVVSTDTTLWHLLRELAALDEVFTHVFRLPAFGLEEIEQLVDLRLGLLNQAVDFESSRWAAVLDRLRGMSERKRFYRRLWRASRGNPGRALTLCRQALTPDTRALRLRSDAMDAARPCVYEFTSPQLAALATLHRYGAQPLTRLAVELELSIPDLRRSVSFLATSGLVSELEGDVVELAPAAVGAVFETLLRARLAMEE